MTSGSIKLVLADVDGTLVTPDKVLTDGAVAAVRQLGEAGIVFAITSGRPPRGMEMLVEPLALSAPIAAFNGGIYTYPDMTVLAQHTVPDDVATRVMTVLEGDGLDVWVYRGAEWYVRDPDAPHVDREAWTVKFDPTVVDSFAGMSDVVKIVGVTDDHDRAQRTVAAIRDECGDHVSAALSQPYYADITHPDANKGAVARSLATRYGLMPDEIATIGDMPNDILMFANSGLSIAMGQSGPEVHRAARRVTASNEEEGFAKAMERYVLRTSGAA